MDILERGFILITKRKFISNIVTAEDFQIGKFNLISSGCGTGKSKFVAEKLLDLMPDIQPYEVLLVTSRSLTVEQQSKPDGMSKFDKRDKVTVDFWNEESDDFSRVSDRGMQVMTYDKIISITKTQNSSSGKTLGRVKILVLDECHCLFSDVFIRGMDGFRQWVRRTADLNGMLVIGMTATPDIMFQYGASGGFAIHRVNKGILPGHVAKRMIATNFDTIPYLLASGKLTGKTLIMCPSVSQCKTLKASIPNSTILVSASNKECTPEMRRIRNHLAYESKLPEYFREEDADGRLVERELNVLITTSTAREGFNLDKSSGVKNIVCCLTDPLHVTQFVGRARYNLDKIVVADAYVQVDNGSKDNILARQRLLFKSFLRNRENIKWFEHVAHLVEHDVYGVKRFTLSSDESRFIGYINRKWLLPTDASKDDVRARRIYKPHDVDEIVTEFRQCKLLDRPDSDISFATVVRTLTSCLGYKVTEGRVRYEGAQKRYKLVVDYDEGQNIYTKQVNPLPDIDELVEDDLLKASCSKREYDEEG